MNIFILDKDPRIAASYHCDTHVMKQMIESAQMLANAYYAQLGITHRRQVDALPEERRAILAEVFDGFPRTDSDGNIRPYSPSHFHHPCSAWARETRANWEWLWELARWLGVEYTLRYGAVHQTEHVLAWMKRHRPLLPEGPLTPHPQVVPDELRVPGDPVAAYRHYYNRDKGRIAGWRLGNTPFWFTRQQEITTHEEGEEAEGSGRGDG